jgi:antirestriction protein
MKALFFNSENDAYLVASQLYNCELEGIVIKYREIEEPAVTLAISLAGVELPIIEGACSLLPFPRHERECTDEDTSKIYVACLSAYNSGHLHRMWIDATQDSSEIQEDIDWMLSWSPVRDTEACEEWAIHDYENWQDIKLGEHEDIEHIAELAQLLEEHGKAYALYYEHYGSDTTAEDFQERYLGQYEDEEDFVYEMWEQDGTLKKLQEIGINECYINWEAIARDWFISDFFSAEVGYNETYVFSRH